MSQQAEFQTLSQPVVKQIISKINEEIEQPELLSSLKQQWPDFRFIVCSELDMDMKPEFHAGDEYLIYLIAASFGCASLTEHPEKAIGVVIAMRELD